MKERKTPQQKKALFYRKDHHVLTEWPHSFARQWPRKKARANRKYRRRVGQVLAKSVRQYEREDRDAWTPRPLPARRDPVRKWEPPMRMREWVTSRLDNRIRRTAWNYFRQPYVRTRHRDRFVGFLKDVTAGHSEYSSHLARAMNELLEPPEPVRSRGEGLWEFSLMFPSNTGQARVWLAAFFADEPAWERHLRQWIRDLLL